METYYMDPLGMTRQTETILRGLGASDLIPECRKRNISTQTLHELSEDDFVRLGASREQAVEMRAALVASNRKMHHKSYTLKERVSHFPEIVKNGNEQLMLMQAYISYMRLRLTEEQLDSFVEVDTPYTASQALVNAVNATLTEVDELNEDLLDLEHIIRKSRPRQPYKRNHLFIGGISLLITLGLTFIVLRRSAK